MSRGTKRMDLLVATVGEIGTSYKARLYPSPDAEVKIDVPVAMWVSGLVPAFFAAAERAFMLQDFDQTETLRVAS